MSGLAAICLTARLGSTRPSITTGFELEVVTMVVLGGVSILGGSGSIPGVVIAAVVMGLVTFGLGLLNELLEVGGWDRFVHHQHQGQIPDQ